MTRRHIPPILVRRNRIRNWVVAWRALADMGTQTSIRAGANSLQQEGKKAARGATTSPIVETLMRLGYGVRGLVYGVIGVLAFQMAIGAGGALADTQGAIVALGKTSFGGAVCAGVLVGLIGYALWGVIRAVFDPLHKGADPQGIAERVGYAVSALSYMLLAFATYGLIIGGTSAARNGAQAAQTQQATASILSKSWGPWVVGIVAVTLTGVGLSQIISGLAP